VTGTVCLQGGNEFAAGCREMDAALVDAADGRVVVTALAGAPGREYDTATRNGVEHFARLGADVVGAPDVRSDPAGALQALRSARLLVLPGGSPSRLLSVLRDTPVGAVVTGLVADDGVVLGSSAGAMVLCAWTVLPEHGPTVAPGLGVVPGLLVVPHWTGGQVDWLRAVEDGPGADVTVLGVPEESGVVWRDGVLTAVGSAPTTLVATGDRIALGATWRVA
jgi:cyanophycinase